MQKKLEKKKLEHFFRKKGFSDLNFAKIISEDVGKTYLKKCS